MNRAEVLLKLLRLGPLEPLFAQSVCGWPVDEFQTALATAIENGWVRVARGCNQYKTRLEVAA